MGAFALRKITKRPIQCPRIRIQIIRKRRDACGQFGAVKQVASYCARSCVVLLDLIGEIKVVEMQIFVGLRPIDPSCERQDHSPN